MIHEDSLDVCFEGYVFRLQIVATNEVEAVQLAGIVLLFLAVTFSIILTSFFLMRLRSGLGGKISINNSIAAVQLNVARNVAVAPLHHHRTRYQIAK